MRTKLISTCRVFPATAQNEQHEVPLGAIDAWYTYRRSLPVIYLFHPPSNLQNRATLAKEFVDSLAKTLDVFPQLAGTINPSSLDVATYDGRVTAVKRPKLSWGGKETVGVQFIEAEINTTLQELLPPASSGDHAYIWDRSAVPINRLFPKAPLSETLVQIQLTWLRCGGFSIAADMDHGIADAKVVSLFMQYWSSNFSKATPRGLPPISYQSGLENRMVLDYPHPEKMVEHAARLSFRRPFQRDHIESSTTPVSPQGEDTVVLKCMFHFPATMYRRITSDIQLAASARVTDQIAVAGLLWAAVNRARSSLGYAVDLHLSVSLRGMLDFPDGALGSPLLNVMLRCTEKADDAAELAVAIMETLSQYDENAMRAIMYQAALEDSPEDSHRPKDKAENILFTSTVQSGWTSVKFGPYRPVFVAPLLPIRNLFVMTENLPTDERAGTTAREWYGDGVNIFFDVPEDVYETMSSDPAFAEFAKLRDI